MKIHSKASENHGRFEVKRIKSGSFRREVLNICSLINMPGKYISNEEKARILAWRQEKEPIKSYVSGVQEGNNHHEALGSSQRASK